MDFFPQRGSDQLSGGEALGKLLWIKFADTLCLCQHRYRLDWIRRHGRRALWITSNSAGTVE
jgi:hypothetical protein